MKHGPNPKLWLLLLALSALLSSCSHYHWGRPGVDPDSSPTRLWIAPILLEAVVADAWVPLQRELREQAIRDPLLQLVESSAQADVQLHVILSAMQRETIARRTEDTELAEVMQVDLRVRYELVSSAGNPIRSGELDAVGPIFREAGFAESTRQRMPAMLNTLAQDILQEAFLSW